MCNGKHGAFLLQAGFTVLVAGCLPGSLQAQAERDLIDVINHDLKINTNKVFGHTRQKKIYYSFLPSGSALPGGGVALFSSTTAHFYTGDRATTSISNITFSPYITFSGRFGYTLRSNIWLENDHWDIMGDTRFLFYPQHTWGLGGNPAKSSRLLLNYKYGRFYQTFLKAIKPYFLVGAGYHFDHRWDIDAGTDTAGMETFTHYKYGTSASETSLSSGVSLNLLYDERRNPNDPHPGFYGNIVYRFNTSLLGSNRKWESLYVDTRKYIAFSPQKQNMLAFWAFYWTTFNQQTPYLDLPSIGWDPYQQRSGRGFSQNRYRGKGLVYFETEYRRDITSNGLLGFVLFTNMNSVTEPVTYKYKYLHLAAGGGMRCKFNKRSHTNIALDYGISKGYSGISFNLGETF